MKLNDTLFVVHSGLYLNQQGKIDTLALATVGFIVELDTTTAKFCLYLLLKRDQPFFRAKVRNNPKVEVRKGDKPLANIYYRKAPIVITKCRLSVPVSVYRRDKPSINIYTDNCNE